MLSSLTGVDRHFFCSAAEKGNKSYFFFYITKQITIIIDLVIMFKGIVLPPFFKVRLITRTRNQIAIARFAAILVHF